MKLAIVNDSAIAIEALRRVVVTDPQYELIWVAKDGAEAVAFAQFKRPDIILMDLLMPEMDGVEATRRIMAESPCAVLVVTATVEGNCDMVYEAMGHGALDAVSTPVLGAAGSVEGGHPLLEKITAIATLIQAHHGDIVRAELPPLGRPAVECDHSLLAIGASTGGPQALGKILSALPPDFSAPTVIIQHVDRHFAGGLASWLHERSPLEIRLAKPNSRLEPGIAWLAASDDHLVVENDLTLHYSKRPRDTPYRPSVDVFFESAARAPIARGIGVLLTGMGRDGARGLRTLRDKGWHTIAQDRASSVVYGMPKAAVDLEAAETILPIDRVAKDVINYFRT